MAEGARHVEFIGLDRVERQGQRFGFGGSIDLAKALSAEVLLATELNGAPLPPVHGFPLRAVVPGLDRRAERQVARPDHAHRRAVPELLPEQGVSVQRELNPGGSARRHHGRRDDRRAAQRRDPGPAPDQVVPAGRVLVRGWAMGAEGRPPTAVEVSPNAGEDWVRARIVVEGAAWTWALWEADGRAGLAAGTRWPPAPPTATGATQPRTLGETWNVKGYGNNAWHRVAIRAE